MAFSGKPVSKALGVHADRARFEIAIGIIVLIFIPPNYDDLFQLKYVLNSKLQLIRELQIG